MFSRNKLTYVQTLDVIEKSVYEFVKPYGFIKFGRTLGRFVDDDIFQLISFQLITPEVINLKTGARKKEKAKRLAVNLGIRIPECAQRSFTPDGKEKYYHDYDCNIRSRLADTYSLEASVSDTAERIIASLGDVLPVFETLSGRQAILDNREKIIEFGNSGSVLLDEVMIYGRLGKTEKAETLFNEYYATVAHKGHQEYLEKLALQLNIDIKNGQ